MNPSSQSQAQAIALELAKAFRALELYPPAHPQLRNILKSAYQKVKSKLAFNKETIFSVKKDGLYFQGEKISADIEALNQFSQELHIRQIKKFAFREEISEREFIDFLKMLLIPAEDFRSGKKIEEYLKQKRISSIWVNEVDFKKVFIGEAGALDEEANQLASEKEKQEFIRLSQLVQALDLAGEDSQALKILEQMAPEAQRLAEEKKFPELWYLAGEISYFLEEKGEQFPNSKSKALAIILNCARKDFLSWLLDRFLSSQPEEAEAFVRFFNQTEAQSLPAMVERLLAPESLFFQKELINYLKQKGEKVRSLIEEKLFQAPASSARKLIYLLGEIRSEKSTQALISFAQGKNLGLKKEAIRALAKIRSAKAGFFLVSLLRDKTLDDEAKLLLIQALGERKEKSAVPALIQLLKSRTSDLEVRKKAIDALVKIRSRESIPALIDILKKSGWLRKSAPDELKIKALEALFKINPERVQPWLEKYSSHSGLLGEYSQRLLEQLKQGAEK